MSDDPLFLRLVEEALASDLSPDTVCAEHPELLLQVREQLQRCQVLDAELAAMFPPAQLRPAGKNGSTATDLPQIAGYEIESVLGRGGMGIVYQARHLKLNRRVALKMVLAGHYSSELERIRFMREAETIAALKHPNIVQIYDLGDYDSGSFFTMELMEGGSLAQKLGGMPQPATNAAALVAALAEAMQFAHDKGIIHRDLKPANILLTESGTSKISDFGLARRVEDECALTFRGARVGTPSYMAPEQAAGKLECIGPATDIYALGAILYEMLTGRPPFRAETVAETERQIIHEEPAPPARLNAKIPADLQTICLKALEKPPQRRFASAAELAADLERFLRGEPIRARPVHWLEKSWRWSLRNRSSAIAIAAMALLLIAAVAGSLGAAAHYRALASVEAQLADTHQAKRQEAEEATVRETKLREEAETLWQEMRRANYLAEMNLAGQSALQTSGLGRTNQLLSQWERSHPDIRQWEWYFLHALCNQDLRRYRVEIGSTHRIAWDPAGVRLASPHGHAVWIWTPALPGAPQRLHGHTGAVAAIAWRADGQQLASVSSDHTLRIWDASTGKELQLFRADDEGLISVAWSPDGKQIAAGSDRQRIFVWDVATGERHELRGHTGPVRGLAWHPQRRWLASGSSDTKVIVWDLATNSILRTLDSHLNWVNQVAWSADGTRLASGSNDHTAKIWDAADGRELLTLTGHSLGVTDLAWSADGTRLATASDDQTIKVLAANGGAELFAIRGHSAPLTSIAWNSPGDRIASASFDGTVRVWNAVAASEALPPEFPAPIRGIAWNPQEPAQLAVVGTDGEVQIWDKRQHQIVQRLHASDQPLRAVAWHPDGKRLAVSGDDGVVRVWDLTSEQLIAELVGHLGEVLALDWDVSGERLVSSCADCQIRIWRPATHEVPLVLTGHKELVHCVRFSPDGRKIASASGDNTAKIWDAATGQETMSFMGHWGQVLTIDWHRNGRTLATGSHDGTVQIWDCDSGKRSKLLSGHNANLLCIAWSPDCRRIASAANDGTVKVWDPQSSREAITLVKQPHLINTLAWSADGTTLATGSEYRWLRLYDATHGYVVDRSKHLLPKLNRQSKSNTISTDDVLLRAETLAYDGQWNAAARDMQRYLMQTKLPWHVLDGHVAGPFPLDQPDDAEASIEAALSGGNQFATASDALRQPFWNRVRHSGHGFVELGELCEKRAHVSAYVWYPIFSQGEKPVTILWGSDDQAQLWLNGQPIAEWHQARPAAPDNNRVDTVLRPGWNSLIVKVQNETGDHALYLRLVDHLDE